MKKTTKRDWVLAGRQALLEKGETAIRIDYLCQKLNVSKGSFYHHFASIDQYITELMEFWKAENTTSIIQEAEDNAAFAQKTEKLNTLVLEKDQRLEVMIRAWAVRDSPIQAFVDEIDQLRLAYLQKLYIEQGLPADRALDLARIEYGTLIGMQHLFLNQPMTEFQRLSQVFQQIINNHIR